MPYGPTGATQTCQQGLDEVLKDCRDCVDNYVDDFIVFSDNMEAHICDLCRVLSRLLAAGFTLRGSKCLFSKSTITHLGFQYTQNGVTPAREKSRAVVDWLTPTSAKEVRSFLGLVNFYRRFIPNFSQVAGPLTDLTGNGAIFCWQGPQQQAFIGPQTGPDLTPCAGLPKTDRHFCLNNGCLRHGHWCRLRDCKRHSG